MIRKHAIQNINRLTKLLDNASQPYIRQQHLYRLHPELQSEHLAKYRNYLITKKQSRYDYLNARWDSKNVKYQHEFQHTHYLDLYKLRTSITQLEAGRIIRTRIVSKSGIMNTINLLPSDFKNKNTLHDAINAKDFSSKKNLNHIIVNHLYFKISRSTLKVLNSIINNYKINKLIRSKYWLLQYNLNYNLSISSQYCKYSYIILPIFANYKYDQKHIKQKINAMLNYHPSDFLAWYFYDYKHQGLFIKPIRNNY